MLRTMKIDEKAKEVRELDLKLHIAKMELEIFECQFAIAQLKQELESIKEPASKTRAIEIP